MTITIVDDELCKKIEQNVAVSSERFKEIKELSDHGIYCDILFMPILPLINDMEENVLEIVRLAKEKGAKFIYPAFGVTLRTNQREYYYQKLDKHFPTLTETYIRQYGDRYSCSSPKANALYTLFVNECNKVGLLYKMENIIEDDKRGDGRQQLFLL